MTASIRKDKIKKKMTESKKKKKGKLMLTDFLFYSYHLCLCTEQSKCPRVLGFSFPSAIPALLHHSVEIKTNHTPL